MAGGQAVRYWVWRDLGHRSRAALVLAALTFIAAVVPLVAAAGARRTATSWSRMEAEIRPVHLNIQFEGDNPPPEDVLERLAALPGVAHAGEGASFIAHPIGTERAPFTAFGQGGLRGGVGRAYERSRMYEGRMPSAPDEALASADLAEELDLEVGSTFTVRTYSPEGVGRIMSGENVDFDGPRIKLRVSGIGDQAEALTAGGEAPAPLFVVAPTFFERWGGRAHFFDGIFLLRLDDGVDLASVVDSARAEFADRDDVSAYGSELASRVEGSVTAQGAALGLLALVAFAAGSLVAAQAARRFTRGADQDEAALRALGFVARDVVRSRLTSVGTPVVAGVVVALVVAIAASGSFPSGSARRLEPEPGVHVDAAVLGGVAAMLLALVAIVVVLSTRGSERSGVRSGRTLPPLVTGRPAVMVGLRSLSSRMPRRPSPAQSAMFACGAGLAGLVGALVFGQSLDRLLTEPVRFGWNWDLAVALGDTQTDDEALAQAEEVAGSSIDEAMYARLATRTYDDLEVTSIGTRAVKGDMHLAIVRGRAPASADEVVFGGRTLDELGKGIGDSVEAATEAGMVRLKIVGQALFPTEENDDPAQGAGVLLETLQRLAGTDGFPNVYVSLAPGVSAEEFKEEVGEGASTIADVVRPGVVVNLENVEQTPYVLAAYLALLAAAATVHALLSAIRHRRRELSVLKVIGFVRRQVGQAVLVEGAAVVAVGVLVGVPLGLAAGRAAWALVAGRLGLATDSSAPVAALAVVVPAAFGLAVAVSLVPATMAGRTHPAAALREE